MKMKKNVQIQKMCGSGSSEWVVVVPLIEMVIDGGTGVG